VQELPDAPADGQPTIDSMSGLLLVLFSMPGGYLLLAIFVFLTARRQPWTFSPVDVLLWACALAIPFAQHRVALRHAARGEARLPWSLGKRVFVHALATAVLWAIAQSVQILG